MWCVSWCALTQSVDGFWKKLFMRLVVTHFNRHVAPLTGQRVKQVVDKLKAELKNRQTFWLWNSGGCF